MVVVGSVGNNKNLRLKNIKILFNFLIFKIAEKNRK